MLIRGFSADFQNIFIINVKKDIPKPQLIIYYAFFKLAYLNLKSMKDDQKIAILLEYYLRNEKLLEKLEKRLGHGFPDLPKYSWKIQSF